MKSLDNQHEVLIKDVSTAQCENYYSDPPLRTSVSLLICEFLVTKMSQFTTAFMLSSVPLISC